MARGLDDLARGEVENWDTVSTQLEAELAHVEQHPALLGDVGELVAGDNELLEGVEPDDRA